MYVRTAVLFCIVSWALIGCGQGDSQPGRVAGDSGDSASSADAASTEILGINFEPNVDMVTKQRITMDVMLVDEFEKVFSTTTYPSLADAIMGAELLRSEPTIEKAAAVEAAINAISDNILIVDEPKLQEIMAEVMGNMMQFAMMDYMVQTTRIMMDALVAAFPLSEYPRMQEFRRVANDVLADPSMEKGEELNAAVDSFKAGLSQADLARFEEIEASVEHKQAVAATEQGNKAAVEMWLGSAEEQKNQIWSTPGPRISKVAYNELQEGMSYNQVVKILEREGNSTGRATGTFNDVSTVSEAYQWVWENADGTGGKIEGYFLNETLAAKVYFNDLR